jgi:hypothetical protein
MPGRRQHAPMPESNRLNTLNNSHKLEVRVHSLGHAPKLGPSAFRCGSLDLLSPGHRQCLGLPILHLRRCTRYGPHTRLPIRHQLLLKRFHLLSRWSGTGNSPSGLPVHFQSALVHPTGLTSGRLPAFFLDCAVGPYFVLRSLCAVGHSLRPCRRSDGDRGRFRAIRAIELGLRLGVRFVHTLHHSPFPVPVHNAVPVGVDTIRAVGLEVRVQVERGMGVVGRMGCCGCVPGEVLGAVPGCERSVIPARGSGGVGASCIQIDRSRMSDSTWATHMLILCFCVHSGRQGYEEG